MKKRIIHLAIVMIALLFPVFLNAQYTNWVQYTNGRHITAIAEESTVIWVGTTGGLVKINKSTLQIINIYTSAQNPIASNRISAIAVDGQGYKWIGTRGKGVVRFIESEPTPTLYKRPAIPSDEVNAIVIRNNEAWVGTNAGLARWSGTAWTVYNVISKTLPSDTVTSLALDKNGNLLIGTWRGVVRYNGSQFSDLSIGLSERIIKSVVADTSGRPWVGTWGGGAAQYQGTAWSQYRSPSPLPSDFINAVTVDLANRVWVGTLQNGLVRYENFAWSAAIDTNNSQIPDNNITVLFPGTDGSLWVGTRGGGLARLSGSVWTSVQTSNSGFTEDNVLSVAVSSTGDIWTCGPGDVSHFNGNSWTTYTSASLGLFQGGFTGLALDSQGRPWVGTFEQGVFRFNGSSWTAYNTSNTSGFPGNFINAITAAPNGDIWIATYNGAGRFNGTSWTTYNTASSPAIPSSYVRAVAVGANNTVWIADAQSLGPLRFDQTSWTVVSAAAIGITPGTIQSIWVSETGGPWIGTEAGGIAHYTSGSWQYHSTAQNSTLPSNDVRSIQSDTDGNLWIGTANGLAKLVRPTTFTNVYKFTDSGMPTNSVRSIAVGSDNRIYAATDSGLAVYSGFQKTGSNLTIRNRMFEYGTVTIGQTSTRSSWVANKINASVRIDSIVFYPRNIGGFTLVSQPPPFTVASNDSFQISIRFQPTQVLFYGGNVRVYSGGLTARADTLYIGGTVTAQRIAAPFYLHPETYGMISIPGVLQNKDIRSVFSSLGPYDSKSWRVFYWKNKRYLELTEFLPSDSLFFKPGIAFWLITKDTVQIALQNISATPAIEYVGAFAQVANYPIVLKPEWNMIGNPFAYSVQWNQIINSNLVQNPVIWSGTQYYYNLTSLYPWEGYFVYNPQSVSVTLYVPPFSSIPKTERTPLSEGEFILQIKARGMNSGFVDDQNEVGMRVSASEGFDKEDYLEAPPIGDGLQLSILQGKNRFAGDFKAVSGSGAAWELSLSTTGKKELTELTFDEKSPLQSHFQVWLLDEDHGGFIPILNGKTKVNVEGKGTLRRFRLIVGTEEYANQEKASIPPIPYRFSLLPNFPNPFNPETQIKYELAETISVRLEIINLLGQRIRIWEEADQPAGYHQVSWNGKDEKGIPVKSGLYIFKISAGSFQASQKMCLIR